MTEERTRMKIGIDGKVYTLDTAIQKSLTQIPWKSRKKVIAVLEAMKQAEHVEKPKQPEPVIQPPKLVEPLPQSTPSKIPKEHPTTANSHSTETQTTDPDVLMQQLIMQQPSHNIPDKMTAIKWIAIFFAVIISLAILI